MFELNFTTIGNRKAFVIDDEGDSGIRLTDGERFHAIESPAGFLLCKIDPETIAQVEIAQEVMKNRRDALRRLAE